MESLFNSDILKYLILLLLIYCIIKLLQNNSNCINGFSVGIQKEKCRNKRLCSGHSEAKDFCWDPRQGYNAGLDSVGSLDADCNTQESMFQYSDLCDDSKSFYLPLSDSGGDYTGKASDKHCLQSSSDPRPVYACGKGGTKCLDCTLDINKKLPACLLQPKTNQADCERNCTAQFNTFSCKNTPINANKIKCQKNYEAKKVDPQKNIFANLKDCLAQGCGHKCDPALGQKARSGCNKPTNHRDGGFETPDDCHDACKPRWGCPLGLAKKDANGCVQCQKFMPGEPGHKLAQYDTPQKCKEGHCGNIYRCNHQSGKCECTDIPAGVGQNKPACKTTCTKEKFAKYVCPSNKKFSAAGCIQVPANNNAEPYSYDTRLPNSAELSQYAKQNCDAFSLNGKRCNKPCEYDFDTDCIYDKMSNTCTKNINTTPGTGIYDNIDSCEFKDDNMTCTPDNQDYKTNCPQECDGKIDSSDPCDPILTITQPPNKKAIDNNLGCESKYPQFDIDPEGNKQPEYHLRNKPITDDCNPCNDNALCDKATNPLRVCHLDYDKDHKIVCNAECRDGFIPDPANLDNCKEIEVSNCKADSCNKSNEICVESGPGTHKCICDDNYIRENGNKDDECVLPAQDCLGYWSDCDANCISTYSIYKGKNDRGEDCKHNPGSTKKCTVGTDDCVNQCIGLDCPNPGEQCINIPQDAAPGYSAKCLGAKGKRGKTGKTGNTGKTGKTGKTGDPGRDACSYRHDKVKCEKDGDCYWASIAGGPELCRPNMKK